MLAKHHVAYILTVVGLNFLIRAAFEDRKLAPFVVGVTFLSIGVGIAARLGRSRPAE